MPAVAKSSVILQFALVGFVLGFAANFRLALSLHKCPLLELILEGYRKKKKRKKK